MRGISVVLCSVGLCCVAIAQPYDFSAADEWLTNSLPDLDGNVAVIVRQDGVELYRFQAGAIDYDTRNRLASFTKTISAGVILSLVDDGLLALDEPIGETYPIFAANGIGDATVLDCWAMRHGIDSAIAYERDARFTLAESVARIGLTGYLVHEPTTQLGYDGSGMQTVGGIAALRAQDSWHNIARNRIFDLCDMPQADYLQFDPNPAVAGGLRSTAEETMNYAQMIIDNGVYDGVRVLSENAVELMFTNHTRGLPVFAAPFPETHPFYPYGAAPDYAFGAWVLAENPSTQHVEEIVGAGAWGSYIWLDQRRGLTAVLITDIQPATQTSMTPALGLFEIARQQTEANQVRGLQAAEIGDGVHLRWTMPAGASFVRVYGAFEPIRDIYDLRAAALLTEANAECAAVPSYPYYVATAVFPELENTALVPRGNALADLASRPDLNGDGLVDVGDFAWWESALGGDAALGDVDLDGDTDVRDFAVLQGWFGADACP